MTPLDFAAARDDGSESWTRAQSALLAGRALLERVRWNEWVVMLPGGSAHHVTAERDHGAVVGRCDGRGFQFADPGVPCAHLCALRMAAVIDYTDVHGRPVRILDADQRRADHAVEEQRARADGGTVGGRR